MKVCAITYITQNKDNIPPVGVYHDDWEYFCYTDDPDFRHPVYTPIIIPKIEDFEENVRRTIALKYMTHLDKTFKDFDVHVVHDGNIVINATLLDLIGKSKGGIGLFGHWWNCIYEAFAGKRELIANGMDGFDTLENLDNHEKRYKQRKFPKNFGYWAVGVMIKDMTGKKVIAFLDEWKKEYDEGCYRDQLSVPWAVKKSGVRIERFGIVCRSGDFNRNFKWFAHEHGGH